MIRPGTFERVFTALKQQLGSGAFRPGQRLEPALLASELNASVTPVRDALHRLTGERLVEAPRHEGFRVPLLTESMLRHLYGWHRDLVLLALMSRAQCAPVAGEVPSEDQQSSDSVDRQNSLFLSLARETGNPEHVLALQSVIQRLVPVQRLEPVLLDAIEEETARITAALRANDRKQLRAALVHYHRRRAKIIPDLLERAISDGP